MIVSPSLLSADFAHLADDLEMINASSAQMLHLDVMDGVFVPNISFGFPVMKYVQKYCTKPLDVHLMIVEPQKFVSEVRDCGAEIMNVHYEVCPHLNRVVQQIHDAGMRAGVTLNPATPVWVLRDIVAEVELVLLMSVNPGFGGQKFIETAYRKLRQLQALCFERGVSPLVEIDGGITDANVESVVAAGANVIVAGSCVFSAPDHAAMVERLRELGRQGLGGRL